LDHSAGKCAKLVAGRVETALDVKGRAVYSQASRDRLTRPKKGLFKLITMNQAPYIPARDADFSAWLLNFSTLLTATPAAFGLVAGDAVIVAAQNTAFQAAYLLATDPGTRTSPTVAAKDAARVTAEGVVRPYAVGISRNAAVTPENKTAIGVNLPNTAPVPVPPPLTFPQLGFRSAEPLTHVLQYQDSGLGTGKRKPFGAIACELWRSVGTVAATDPAQARFYGLFTKSPLRSSFEAPEVGKVCTYFARWTTRSGPAGAAQPGPWSAPLTIAVI
jgi:hypothetical protein